ncbi:phage integrase SAM-like domain-containing protein [Spirosoma daeguense]
MCLTINGIEYGPYTTGIFTYRAIWDGGRAARVSAESHALIAELGKYQTLLTQAYEELKSRGIALDGSKVMDAFAWLMHRQQQPDAIGEDSPFEIVTLQRVYKEFMEARGNVVEKDRRKRSLEQISDNTYNTYPRRWVLIANFLHSEKKQKLPVSAVDYPMAIRLKEWLQKQPKMDGGRYHIATINRSIGFLKTLLTYALTKGYVKINALESFACRGNSTANPKPLTEAQLQTLETVTLSPLHRWICDSWLIAGELCLHYSDYKELPSMQIIERPHGLRFIQHDRNKQNGSKLWQTVNITPRAERLLDKWGIRGLYYKSNTAFNNALKTIARLAELKDEKGEIISLEFGQGRDSGLTARAINGANGIQLSKIAGWSKPLYAERYIGNPVAIVEEFVKSSKRNNDPTPNPSQPFIQIQKVS